MSNIPISSLPVALSLDGSEEVPVVQGGTTKRTSTGAIANTATGFVPTTRQIITPTAGGITGGGSLAADLTLNWNPFNLLPKTAMVVADSFAINDSSLNAPAKVTFPNAMKAVTGLPALAFPSPTGDFLVINHAADGLSYKVSPSSLNLTAGNVPAGGLTSQVLTKNSNADYDTTWTFSGFVAEPANFFLGGPATGVSALPTFRALVAADLPNPTSTTKGGVKSYAAVTNQFINAIATDGTPSSAQPAFSNISGTALVSQGGTGATSFTTHGVLLGEGTSAVVSTAAMTDGQLLIGQTGADPSPETVSGDVTISNLGVTAIGNNKVTNAMIRQGVARSIIGVTGNATANVADIQGTANQALVVNSAGTALAFGQVNLASTAAVTGTLPSTQGGTDNSSYAIGDILYASGTTALSKLSDIATGNALLSGGVATAPSWGKIDLTAAVTGVLPIANGGTGGSSASTSFDALAPTTTRGDMIARNATTNARLGIGSANTVLRTNGTDPSWGAVNLATDTTGQLIVANGGTGALAFTVNGILYGNNTSPVQVTAAGTNGTVLAGNTGAAPTFNTVSSVLDAIGNTQGNILYRSASGWNALAVGTSGQVLSTQGAGANPQWISAAGVGTVTSVDVSGGTTGLTTSGGPITAAGTITLAGTLGTANGGTNLTSYTQGDILYATTSSVISKLAKDTNATRYLSNTGTTNNPAWAQINLANGVTGSLPLANIASIANSTVLGNFTGASAAPTAYTAREVLTGSRTYYVRTDGNNSNTGLVNSSGGAWLTIQYAVNFVLNNIDMDGQALTIQVVDGTYTAGLALTGGYPFVGGVPLLQGNTTTPSNCVIAPSSPTVAGIQVTFPCNLKIGGFKIAQATNLTYGVRVSGGAALIILGKMEYGAVADSHITVASNGSLFIDADYTISGNAGLHFRVYDTGFLEFGGGQTVTLTGTPAFSFVFAYGTQGGNISGQSVTYTGAATGQRYQATVNGIVNSGGGGANYFPGNSPGSTATGGQYN